MTGREINEVGRTCLGCKHFRFQEAQPGYSEVTPGSDGSIECYKNVWFFQFYSGSDAEFRRVLLTAQACEHYEFAPERLS